jgi:prepilin-type N-terminal cleavage/methylation domain-containing protein
MNYRNKKSLFDKRYRSLKSGLTLMEMIIALSIITIVFASIFPLFGQIRDGWDSKQAAADTLQNGRILIDHMNRNLAKAVKVTAVSISSDISGYIEFEDNDAAIFRYDVNSATDYVEYGSAGGLSDLAGPVSRLRFICYDACDLDAPLDISTADVNDIRFVKAETILTSSSSPGQEKTLVA